MTRGEEQASTPRARRRSRPPIEQLATDPRKTFTLGEAADYLGEPLSTLRDWCRRGRLVAGKTPTGEWRLPKSTLLELEAQLFGEPRRAS